MTCMHDERLPATRRLFGFMKQASWEKHINECYGSYLEKQGKADFISCPDPDCSLTHKSDQDLWYHLQDDHSYPRRTSKTETKSEKDILVVRGYKGLQRKRHQVSGEVEEIEPKSALTTGSKWKTEPTWSMSNLINPRANEQDGDTISSDASTPSTPMFDTRGPQDGWSPATSISPRSHSSVDGAHYFGSPHETSSTYPSSPMRSDDIDMQDLAWDERHRIESVAQPPFCNDVLEVDPGEVSMNHNPNAEPSLPKMSYSDFPVEIMGPRDRDMAERTTDLSPPTILTETIHPQLRNHLSPVEGIGGQAAKSFPGNKDSTSVPVAIDDEENIWEVEELLAKWTRGRQVFYLVKWKGFAHSANTFEKRNDINIKLVSEFEADYHGNHKGVELLSKRVHRRKVQYKVRWKGRPDSDNSWENADTISRERIVEYEARMLDSASVF